MSEVVIKVVHGRTLLPSRTFKRGEAVPQFSVGSRGDWIVSAPGVVSFHLLLIFDGERVFAASIDAGAPVYLEGSAIGNNWNLVAPSKELRFGEASIVVARQASNAPPAGRSAFPPRPTRPPPPVGYSPNNAPVTVREPGPGKTQFFENLQAQQAAGTDKPSTHPSGPPGALATAPTMAALTAEPRPEPRSTFPLAPALASPPPLLSQSVASEGPQPPPVFSASSLPIGPPTPLASGLPTIASESSLMNQSTGAWRDPSSMEHATYFAPPGSIALPAQDLRPTDDGGPLPMMLPSPLPALPMMANAAEAETYSTVLAGEELREFAVNLPPSPMDPQMQMADPAYMPTYAESHVPQHHPSAQPVPERWSQSPQVRKKGGRKWLWLVLLPLAFVGLLLLATLWFLIAR